MLFVQPKISKLSCIQTYTIPFLQPHTFPLFHDQHTHMSEWLSSKSLQSISKDTEKREPLYTVGGNVNWHSRCEEQYGGSSKTKNRTTTRSSNFTAGYIVKEHKTLIKKDKCTPIYIHVTTHMCVYTYVPHYTHQHTMEYYSVIKMSEILPFVTVRMDQERIMLMK